MNFERILNMLLNQLMRQFVNRGVGAGMNALTRRKPAKWSAPKGGTLDDTAPIDDGLTPEDRAELEALKAKQAARRRRRR